MSAVLERRALLKVALLGSGLALGFRLPRRGQAADPPADPPAFLRIDPQGGITLIVPNTEVGQGVYTASAMMMAEELEVGLDQVQVVPAPPDLRRYANPLLGDQATGGSTSTRADWMRLRQAAAAMRMMLVAAAAEQWGAEPSACRVEKGIVHHEASGRSATYAELAEAAARQPVPTEIPLKPASQFRLIGTPAKRLDTPDKVRGAAVFGMDVKVPGMAIGTLAIAPARGAKLLRMDEPAARRVPGVRAVVRAGDEAVAVVADHMWAAKMGLEALSPAWDSGALGAVTTASIVAAMDRASRSPGVVAKREGDAAAAIAGAPTKLSAVYELPFLSHSAMEPLNCTLHIRPDGAEVWVGTQVPVRAQKAVADATGLPQDKVVVHNHLMGGAFGRRLDIDSVGLAAALVKSLPYPVKLVWTREEDVRHDYYRPYYYDRVSAGLDAAGKLVGRTHRVTGPSILARWAPPAFRNGIDSDAVEATEETPYDEQAVLVDYVRHEPEGVNTSWWRGVGPTHNLFVVESFVDEMAAAARKDPVQFRREMLQKNPRALAVLNLAAEKAGWGTPLPTGRGRGIEVQFAFGSYFSCVVEAEVKSGEIILHRVVAAADCGVVVNPDTVRAQLEGGLIFGLGAAMYNRIDFAAGAVEQSNFHDYRSLRINEAPVIEIHLVDSTEAPGGIGESGTAGAAPALGNAIFAATGRRIRRLPFADALGRA